MTTSSPLDWEFLAGAVDGATVEIEGWMAPVEFDAAHRYFFLVPELSCCLGCLPQDPAQAVEVFADNSIPIQAGPVRLRGTWRRLQDDPNGWLWQLRAAQLLTTPQKLSISRRAVLGAMALPLAAMSPAFAQSDDNAIGEILKQNVAIDIHSHAGRILRVAGSEPFIDVAGQMREGGMAAICLAMVADSPATRVQSDGRILAIRQPEEGELYRWSKRAFDRLLALVKDQQLAIIDSAAALRAARPDQPSIIVSAEGADFLDRSIERLDEALTRYGLRHLQLTHYRVNDLGDIQTEAPVHGGLTEFGAEVIRRCNQLGIVVDVAHGTFDLVKRAMEITDKPLVISHTSLAGRPGPRSRQISIEHAKLIAQTGGVIGVWPPASIYPTMDALAAGMARLADAVGVDHVGIGTDQRGLTSASVFDSYTQLPDLVRALQGKGFDRSDIGKIIGGNYLRVFAQTLG
jgi:membrane dipeptidase